MRRAGRLVRGAVGGGTGAESRSTRGTSGAQRGATYCRETVRRLGRGEVKVQIDQYRNHGINAENQCDIPYLYRLWMYD